LVIHCVGMGIGAKIPVGKVFEGEEVIVPILKRRKTLKTGVMTFYS